MTSQEIQELVAELLNKQANKEELTVCEITILDVHEGLKKEGQEISERTIQEIRFMMN